MTNTENPSTAKHDPETLMRLMIDPKTLGSKSVIVYLFSRPETDKLFLSDKRVNLKKIISDAKKALPRIAPQGTILG